MEKLNYRKFKGLEIRCLKCNKTIHKDRSPYNGCKHPVENTVYRAIIIKPNTNGKRVTVTLKARNYDAAIKELIDFRNDIISGKNDAIDKKSIKPQLLIDCMAMYIDFLSGEGQKKSLKNNTNGHVTSMNCHYKTFNEFLKSQKFNIDHFRVTDINKSLASDYDLFIQELTKSAYTFNHKIKAMRSLIAFLIEQYDYKISNHFNDIPLEKEEKTDITITSDDFHLLLEKITPENSVHIDGKGNHRNMYRHWLTDAIKLKAYTGRRNEEVFHFKWSDIVFEDGKPIYMVSNNLKSLRLKKTNRFSTSEDILIPIILELETFLEEKGLYEKQGSDEYIVGPNETSKRKTMQDVASKSFTFFSKKLLRPYPIKMKQLRSTYITADEIYSYRQGPKLKQHANNQTTLKHYVSDSELAKYITEDRSENMFRVFD